MINRCSVFVSSPVPNIGGISNRLETEQGTSFLSRGLLSLGWNSETGRSRGEGL